MNYKVLIGLFLLIPVLVLGYPSRKKLSGAEAAALLPNTSEIVYSIDQSRMEYVRFVEPVDLNGMDAGLFLKGLLGMGSEYTYESVNINASSDNQEHHRYRLAFRGVPVQDAMIVLHYESGNLISFNGGILTKVEPANSILFNESQILPIAMAAVGSQKYRWEDPIEEAHLKWETSNPEASYYPDGKLILLPNSDENEAAYVYAWEFELYSILPTGRNLVYVNASTAEVIQNINLLASADVQGTAVTQYSGNQSITTDSTGITYRLRETGRGNGIETYNCQTSTNYGAAIDFTDTDNYWNNTNTQKDQVATDAHWGAEMTYDYYWHMHSRNSIDGNGFQLMSYVHYDVNYANAFWDGMRMTYGDGSGSMGPLVALDIVAHEISHGLTSYTADLVYSYESGALNEAFSDIFGAAVEFYAKPTVANWTMGENIGGAFRSMSNPKSYGDPDTYLGSNWATGSGDNGGVHTNSGVLNHWFYLLSDGGSGTNDNGDVYNVTGIGIMNAAKVAFRTLTVYLTSNAQYADARFYGIKAAVDLFGPCSPEVASVTNAFYAVGVGPAYYNGALADFSSSDTSFCSVPAEVHFSNISVNGITYTWDFGDGSSSTNISPMHYYNSAGNYTVSLIVDGGICGADTLYKSNLVHVAPPVKPIVIHGGSCGPGIDTLIASAPDTIRWYAPGNVLLHTGDTFITPYLTQSTPYYVTNSQESPSVYGAKFDNSGGGGYFNSSNSHQLYFDCYTPTILRSVKVYAGSSGLRTIQLLDAAGVVLESIDVLIPSGTSRVNLDFPIPVGTDLQLSGPGNPDLFRNSSGCSYPYSVGGSISITASSAWTSPLGYYYYFYDWEVQDQPCVSEVATVWAYINIDAPSAAFAHYQSLDTVKFQNNTLRGNNFYWDFGDGYTSSLKNPSHLYDSTGLYTVVLYAYNGCGIDSSIQQIAVLVTGQSSQKETYLTVYPNPASTSIHISGYTDYSDVEQIGLYNIQGQLMQCSSHRNGNEIVLDVSAYPPGLYILRLISAKQQINKKILIKH